MPLTGVECCLLQVATITTKFIIVLCVDGVGEACDTTRIWQWIANIACRASRGLPTVIGPLLACHQCPYPSAAIIPVSSMAFIVYVQPSTGHVQLLGLKLTL